MLFDFSNPGAIAQWAPIDDRVMGGRSSSRLRHDPAGHAVFEGVVSLEGNGGFASVRAKPAARSKPGAEACLIEVREIRKVREVREAQEVRSAGRRFKLCLFVDDGFDSINHQASFTLADGTWQTLRLPLADFRATFRGREVASAPALEPARIRQVGLMIADRQAGPFALDIRRLSLA